MLYSMLLVTLLSLSLPFYNKNLVMTLQFFIIITITSELRIFENTYHSFSLKRISFIFKK